MKKYADLHIHSTYSDGTFTPEEIVLRAKSLGFSAISITDHDTIEGIEETIHYGKIHNIEVIPGIEFSTRSKKGHQHILGYFIDYKNSRFRKILNTLRKKREERIYKIIKKLQKLKIDISPDDIKNINGSFGRPHIATILLKKGYVSSISEAFDKFLIRGKPAYEPKFKFSAAEVIEIIKRFKGVAIIAHPCQLYYQQDIIKLIYLDADGIEVFYPEHSQKQIEYYLKLAKIYDLLITGGSDCHGYAKDKIFLGTIKLPYKYVEKLKERVRQLNNLY